MLAAVFDVLAEALVEELQRLVGDLLVDGGEALPEERVVGIGYTLEVGDDGKGEGFCVVTHHLACSTVDEAVEEAVSELPHVGLVLLEPLRRHQPLSRWRCAVWSGGSNDGSWSLKGSSYRYLTMMSLMSSPSTGTGKGQTAR